MQSSDIPAKFPIPFGEDAGGGYIRTIPTASQIGINDGFASLADGFPPLNATPKAGGGIPPFIQDMNGILHQVTQWSRWQAAGGGIYFDPAFAASIGGYPAKAVLASATTPGRFWQNQVEGNLADPDVSPSGWLPIGNSTRGSNARGYWKLDPDGTLTQWGHAITGVLANGASTNWGADLPMAFPAFMTGANATLGNGGVGTGSAVTVMDVGTPFNLTSDPILPAPTANRISGFVQNNSTFSTRMLIRWQCTGY